MRQQLTPEAIVHIGQQYHVRAQWERACAVAAALFGPGVARLTISVVTVSEGQRAVQGVQMLALDDAGAVLPFDFTTRWWQQRPLVKMQGARYAEAHLTAMVTSLSAAFPGKVHEVLETLCEEQLGIELLTLWRSEPSLTWTYDCQTPPPITTGISTPTGEALDAAALIEAGREYAERQRWERVREYVQTLYGSRAVRALLIHFSRYNDFRYDRDLRLEVLDATDTRIYYDLRAPWWHRYALSEDIIARYDANRRARSPNDYEEYDAAELEYDDSDYDENGETEFIPVEEASGDTQRLARVLLGVRFTETPESLDDDVEAFDLTTPPPLTYPQLWQGE